MSSRLQSYFTVPINNLGSRITEDLVLCTILIKARNFILRLSFKLLVVLDDVPRNFIIHLILKFLVFFFYLSLRALNDDAITERLSAAQGPYNPHLSVVT